jgi:hypothetical protein
MAVNETRFTPFGITDILKTPGQETNSNAPGKRAEESCVEAQSENGPKDANDQETQLNCGRKREMNTPEYPSKAQGKF